MEALSDERAIHTVFEKDCKDYGKRLSVLCRATAYIWASGSTFRTACDVMVLYLSGILPSSPNHTGPLLGETTPVTKSLQQCCRNGLLPISSEPKQVVYNEFSEEEIRVDTNIVQFFIKKRHEKEVRRLLTKFDKRISIDVVETTFAYEFGPSYFAENDYVVCLYVVSSEDFLFEELVKISQVCLR